jgi:DNA-binding NtrC family response regulator
MLELDECAHTEGAKQARIVVVDTDATLRQFCCRLLSARPGEIVPLDNARLLQEAAASDCVVVYNTEAGWEPLLKWRERRRKVPLVILLDPSAGVSHEAAAQIRPTAILTVPFRPAELESAVERGLAILNAPTP